MRHFAAPVMGAMCGLWIVGMCCARVDQAAINPLAVTEVSVHGVWTDHIIVKIRPGSRVEQLRALLQGDAIRAVAEVSAVAPAIDPPAKDPVRAAKFGLDRYYIVHVAPGTDTRALAAAVNRLTGVVELAEVAPVGLFHSVPNDPLFMSQWAMNNSGQSVGGVAGMADADIDWIEAWQIPHPSAPVVIAVLDTGVSMSHPDLLGQTVPGRCFVCAPGCEGCTDDTTNATQAHGTLCAGIVAAAANNTVGVTGVAGANKVMPLKISSGIAVSQTGTGNALIWAADHGASIVSMSFSWGAGSTVSLVRAGCDYAVDAGLLLVASSGNTPDVAIGPPGNYPEAICVGATTSADRLWPSTTTGPEMDMVAPGENIYTTIDVSGNLNGYTLATGTSMAAPMVAAVASIVWGANPALTAGDVRFLIENSVDDLGAPGPDSTFGVGRLSASAALMASLDTLPDCRVDFNNDGVADIGDLFDFLSIYFSTFGQTGPGLQADFDENGLVSVDDMFSFLAAWFAGC